MIAKLSIAIQLSVELDERSILTPLLVDFEDAFDITFHVKNFPYQINLILSKYTL